LTGPQRTKFVKNNRINVITSEKAICDEESEPSFVLGRTK